MRRHHNNKGHRQIKRGATRRQVERMAKRLGVPVGRKLLGVYTVEEAMNLARREQEPPT